MRNIVLSYLLLPFIAGLSFATTAAPVTLSSTPSPVVATAESGADSRPLTLNLNTADAAALQKALNGIGKAKADAIVMYRDEHGPFTSVDELLEIKGIGKALLDRNRDKLTVD